MFRSLRVAHPDLQQLVELGSMPAGWDLIGQLNASVVTMRF